MKIVQITPSLLLGGAEKFSVELSNQLAHDSKNTVYLFVLEKIEKDNILLPRISDKVNLIQLDKTSGFSLKTILKITKRLSQIDPDIVHTHVRGLIYSSLSLILLRIPTLHTVHNLATKESEDKIRMIYKFLFKYFNIRPASISEEVLKSVQEEYGSDNDILVTNGVQVPKITSEIKKIEKLLETLKPNKKAKVFLNIASINDRKNQLMLIEVFNKLYAEGIDALLLILGDSTGANLKYQEKCRIRAKENPNIHFMGNVPNVGDYLSNADALCLSSKYEGLPLVILEALSLGVPTIGTPAGGIPDVIISGKNGYLSKDFEAESFKNEVMNFLNADLSNHREDMKELFKSSYSIEKNAEEYLENYKRLINSSGK